MMQLDIFSLPIQDCSSRELPKAIAAIDPKVEEAIAVLVELKKLKCKPELVEGCTVRSDLFFKGKTAKIINFKEFANITLAVVELEIKGNLFQFPCSIGALKVIE